MIIGPNFLVNSVPGESLDSLSFVDGAQVELQPTTASTNLALSSALNLNTGTLLTMSFVKIASAAGSDFQLTVSEMHNAIGHSLADSVGVRREIVR